MNWNWTDFYPEWTDPFQIRSSFLEKDLDPIKIQEKWSEFRIWNCCVQFLPMYGLKYPSWLCQRKINASLIYHFNVSEEYNGVWLLMACDV